MSKLYGYTNKILAEVNSNLLSNQDLCKFVYYTDSKYKTVDILEQPNVPIRDILDKNFFVYKRVPETIEKAGAYLFINIYRQTPSVLGGKIKEVTFSIDILLHKDCMQTIHGNRAVCILTAIENALVNCMSSNNMIGKINLVRIAPVLGIIKDFDGYAVQFTAYGFGENHIDRG